MIIIIIFSIGFLLGSVPNAYLILKKIKNVDITTSGSGNVGALNSYQVSSSKLIGLLVLFLDLLKGALTVLIAKHFFPNDFLLVASTLGFAVLGHCYSPWIKFKGGKGLATAAGGAAFLTPSILVIWIFFWLCSFIYRKKVLLANAMATILTLLISISSADIISKEKWFTSPTSHTTIDFILPVSVMLIIILSKHKDFFKEYFLNGIRRK